MPPPKIFIIILQFNNSRDTIRCLESVKELNWPDFQVIVVDNASELNHLNNIRFFVDSQSRTKQRLAVSPERSRTRNKSAASFGTGPRGFVQDQSEEEKTQLVRNEQNLGFSRGVNVGIKKALENGADYVLVLNPDTVVKPDLLTKILETQKLNPKIGIIGTVIDEGDREINCGKISWLKPELVHLRQEVGNILDNGLYIPGAAMLISRKVFAKIGFFDERYFLYFEDADFCERARKAGFKIALAQDRLVYHRPSSSTKSLGSAKLLYYHYRNAHLFNWKNGPWRVKIALPFWSFWIIMKQAIKLLVRRNSQVSRAILNGVADFYKGRFGK